MASVPSWLADLFEGLDDHPAARQLVAAAVAAELCRRLYERGVKEFHFYTLNRADLVYAIIGNRFLNGESIRLDGAIRMAPR